MTRQTLVEALRVLHEQDLIVHIKQTKKRLEIRFTDRWFKDGLLILPLTPTPNDRTRTTKTKNPTNN